MEDLDKFFVQNLNKRLDTEIQEIKEKYEKEVTYTKENEEVMLSSIEKSVKSVSVPNKRKKRQEKIKKDVYVVTAIAVLLTSFATYEIFKVHQNATFNESIKEYKEQIYDTNFYYRGIEYSETLQKNVPLHDHDWQAMIKQIHEKYSNPVTAFFLYYYTLDDYCKKNNLEILLSGINQYYGTDFHSIEDVANYANCKNYDELKEYVEKDLKLLKEGEQMDEYNRSSNFGR